MARRSESGNLPLVKCYSQELQRVNKIESLHLAGEGVTPAAISTLIQKNALAGVGCEMPHVPNVI